MKTSGKVLNIFGIVVALVIGFLIGIIVNFPKVDSSSVSGTIAKINNYRNSQSSTSDIQLQNELTSDTAKLKSFQNYLIFSYLTVVRTAGNIQFAIKEANAIEKFKTSNQSQITNLNNYEQYLSSARTDLLLAISAFQSPGETDPSVLKDLINQVDNIVAQISYKNRTVLDFMEALASYAEANKTGDIQGLRTAHDLLALNEVNTAIMSHDKTLLKSFNKKTILTYEKGLKLIDQQIVNNMILQDIDKLDKAMDSENFGRKVAEKLGMTNVQKLGDVVISEAEKSGYLVYDADYFGAMMDSEMLSLFCLLCLIN